MKRVLIVLLIAVLMTSCGGSYDPPALEETPEATTEDGVPYTIIHIEGMPCIWIHAENGSGKYSTEYAGLDCDWSKHPSNLSQ